MATTRQISKKLKQLENKYLTDRAELFNQYSEAYVEKFNNEKERYVYYSNRFYRIISMKPYVLHCSASKRAMVIATHESGITILSIEDEITRCLKQ